MSSKHQSGRIFIQIHYSVWEYKVSEVIKSQLYLLKLLQTGIQTRRKLCQPFII